MTGSNRRQNTMFRKIFYKFCSNLTYQARLFITKILLHPSHINEFRNTIWKQSIISSNKIHCRQILCNLFFQLAKIYIYIKKKSIFSLEFHGKYGKQQVYTISVYFSSSHIFLWTLTFRMYLSNHLYFLVIVYFPHEI